jgi:hypothetical protein
MISSQTTYVKAIHVPDVDGIDQTNLTKKLSHHRPRIDSLLASRSHALDLSPIGCPFPRLAP